MSILIHLFICNRVNISVIVRVTKAIPCVLQEEGEQEEQEEDLNTTKQNNKTNHKIHRHNKHT